MGKWNLFNKYIFYTLPVYIPNTCQGNILLPRKDPSKPLNLDETTIHRTFDNNRLSSDGKSAMAEFAMNLDDINNGKRFLQ